MINISNSEAIFKTNSAMNVSKNIQKKSAYLDNVNHKSVELSQSSKAYNTVFNTTLSMAQERPLPSYLTTEKRLELLANVVKGVATKIGANFSDKDIARVVGDLKDELKIQGLPKADYNSDSSPIRSFLKKEDQIELDKAYQYALDNNTSFEDVEKAAFALGMQRYVEAMRNDGITYVKYVPIGNTNSDIVETDSTEANVVKEKSSETLSIQEQLEDKNLFATNPYLDTKTFLDAVLESYFDKELEGNQIKYDE